MTIPRKDKKTGARSGPENKAANYFPFAGGRYEMTPGLSRLTRPFGNGQIDSKVLQFDRHFFEYRNQKLLARETDISLHVCKEMLTTRQEMAVHRFLSQQIVSEFPEYFALNNGTDEIRLECALTGDEIYFDSDFRFLGADSVSDQPGPPYQSGLDALSCQLQEDFCIVLTDSDTTRLQYAHICFPNNWLAIDKIGLDFMALHQPVSGFRTTNPNGHKIIAGILNGGPYVRFAWGLSNDKELSHPPRLSKPVLFSATDDPLFIRVERQVLFGMPEIESVLFFIRTYYYDLHFVKDRPDLGKALRSALLTMNEDALRYKGLDQARDAIVDWLKC